MLKGRKKYAQGRVAAVLQPAAASLCICQRKTAASPQAAIFYRQHDVATIKSNRLISMQPSMAYISVAYRQHLAASSLQSSSIGGSYPSVAFGSRMAISKPIRRRL